MEPAVRARDAGREAVQDITPKPLRDRIHALLDDSAMVPAVLTLSSADAADGETAGQPSQSYTVEGVAERAAGVQLIYEGLRLTRTLAGDTPWEKESPHTDANIDVLAADVMVARGFYLLARTDAADKAVETVQSFGKDQTDRQQGRDGTENGLEGDVFELAVVAGTAVVGRTPPTALLAYVSALAADTDADDSDPPEAVPDAVEKAMTGRSPDHVLGGEPRPSATDP
ncbi:DUF7114 family protein [Halorussus halophilus]|uniref:DUF7114 family protein n=1 Tax=Halorussus halophilus TaxID=2650975 RepID=UPI0013016104|nr:hypothetical protein [Halorussus halophilus]